MFYLNNKTEQNEIMKMIRSQWILQAAAFSLLFMVLGQKIWSETIVSSHFFSNFSVFR